MSESTSEKCRSTLVILICSAFFVWFTINVSAHDYPRSGLVLSGIYTGLAIAYIVYVWVFHTEDSTTEDSTTDEERQAVEDWLYSEGYVRYCGIVDFAHDMIIFRLGEEKLAYPCPKNVTDHFCNYKYWDTGKFRTVRSRNEHAENVYYVRF